MSPARYWKALLILLLVFSFVGGAFQLLFSADRIRFFINDLVVQKEPKFNIQFQSAEIKLWDVWRPTFAIELKEIQISAKDPCITNSSMYLNQILVPLDILSVLKKRVRFGHVRAGYVRYFLRPSICSERTGINESADEIAGFERFFQNRWNKEVVNTARLLREFSVQTFELLKDGHALAPLIVEDFNMKFLPALGRSDAKFHVRLGEPWVGNAPVGRLRLESKIAADEVTLEGKGNLKEGQLNLIARWAVDRGDLHYRLMTRDLPLQNVVNLAHHWKFLNTLQTDFKNQWLSCDLTSDGSIRDFFNTPINLHQCRLYGDLGEVLVLTKEIKSILDGGQLSFQVQNMEVKNLLLAFAMKTNWPGIGQFGYFSGLFKILGRDRYSLNGQMKNLEIHSFPIVTGGNQVIEELNLSSEFTSEFSGQINKVIVNSQEAIGQVRFRFSSEKKLEYAIDLSNLKISEDFQKALIGAYAPEISIQGKGLYSIAEFSSFTGVFYFPVLSHSNWVLNDLAVDFAQSADDLKLNIKAESALHAPEGGWDAMVNTLFNYYAVDSKNREWKNLNMQLNYNRGNQIWRWSGLQIQHRNSLIRVKSSGLYSANQQLMGSLTTTFKRQNYDWLLSGEMAVPAITKADAP